MLLSHIQSKDWKCKQCVLIIALVQGSGNKGVEFGLRDKGGFSFIYDFISLK